MPAPGTGPYGPVLSRRRLLATVGAAALLGGVPACTGDDPDPDEPNPPSPTPTPTDPDAERRSDAVGTARSLAAVYQATIAAHPTLTAVLQPLLDDHLAHAAALSPENVPPSSSPPSATASAPTTGTTSATATPGPSVPADPVAAVATLQAAETAASAAARQDAVNAVDSALARLLASIGASRAVHAAILASAA